MDAEKRALVYARQNGRPVAPSPRQRRRMWHKAGRDVTASDAAEYGVTRRVIREMKRLGRSTR